MEYTEPLLLQHRKHFLREVFEVTLLEPEVDIFLPFWWIAKHPPPPKGCGAQRNFASAAPVVWKNVRDLKLRNFLCLWTRR